MDDFWLLLWSVHSSETVATLPRGAVDKHPDRSASARKMVMQRKCDCKGDDEDNVVRSEEESDDEVVVKGKAVQTWVQSLRDVDR